MAGKRKRGSQDGGDKSRNAKVAKKEVDGLLTASAASITVHHSLKGKIQTAEGNILVQNSAIQASNHPAGVSQSKDEQENKDVFYLFPKLPFELRQIIWRYADPDSYTVIQRENTDYFSRLTISRPVPALLHVCKDSCTEYIDEDTPKS